MGGLLDLGAYLVLQMGEYIYIFNSATLRKEILLLFQYLLVQIHYNRVNILIATQKNTTGCNEMDSVLCNTYLQYWHFYY